LLQGTLDLLILKAIGDGEMQGSASRAESSKSRGAFSGKTRIVVFRPAPDGGSRMADLILARIGKQLPCEVLPSQL